MGWPQLRQKYGGHDRRSTLNGAARAEIPGVAEWIAGAAKMHEAKNGPCQRPPEEMVCLRLMLALSNQILDLARGEILRRYQCAEDWAPTKPEPTIAAKPPPIAPPVDPRKWTPPAAIVERMGKDSDGQLARECGVSASVIADYRRRYEIAPADADGEAWRWTPAMDKLLGTRADGELATGWGMSAEAVRRRRIKLGVGASRVKIAGGWTAERLSVLAATSDNAEAARLLGLSEAAVKTARSRQKAKLIRQAKERS